MDHNNCFGGCGLGAIFVTFNSLVTWIAKNIKFIPYLGAYSDGSFGVNQNKNLIWYKKYNKLLPEQQVNLLCLWDELGIPHKEQKKTWGALLTVISINLDHNMMTLTLHQIGEQNSLRNCASSAQQLHNAMVCLSLSNSGNILQGG